MAYSKIILNGDTLMDVTGDTVDAGSLLSGVTATKNSGAKVTGNITSVTHPNPTASIASSTGVITATHTQTTGYVTSGTTTGTLSLNTQAAQTINTSTADQTISSYRWLTGTQTIKSVTTTNLTSANIASGVTVKVGDVNNASRITQITGTYSPATSSLTVTPTETSQTFNATGVYGYKPVTINAISSTYVGTGITTRSAADLTANGSTVTTPAGYYSSQVTKNVASATLATPTISINSVYGEVTAIEKQTTSGYITATSTTTTLQLTSQAAQTIYPSTADQTIASYRWLTGTQTIKSVTTSNLTAANIVSGITVKVGDANNASRISQITGTYSGIIPTGTSEITSNGIYNVYGYASASVNVAGGEYYEVYRSIAKNNTILDSNIQSFIQYIGEISKVSLGQFAYRRFSTGTYTFSNCGSIEQMGFAFFNQIAWNAASIIFSFPICSKIADAAFYNYQTVTEVNFPSCTYIGANAFYCCSSLTTVSFPNCTEIAYLAFHSCKSLTNVNFPNCNSIGMSAFQNCYNLTTVSFPSCTSIRGSAFEYCSSLTSANFSNCSAINDYAFRGCSNLTTAIFPNCSRIGGSAFYYCFSLATISFPNCQSIGSCAFQNCYNLTTVSFPSCSFISASAFRYCSSLISANFSTCSTISSHAFANCSALTEAIFPACTFVNQYVFSSCTNLTKASFPICSSFSANVFNGCYNLISLYLNQVSSVPTYGTNMFLSTPISNYSTVAGRYGSIFVPSSLYAAFTTATGWSAHSARIVSV